MEGDGGDAAQNERAGIVGELLLAVVAFFSDNGDRFEMTKSEFCYDQGWKRRTYRRKRRIDAAIGPDSATPRLETGGVPKVYLFGVKGPLLRAKADSRN